MMTEWPSARPSFLLQDKLPLALLSANAIRCSFPTRLEERRTRVPFLHMLSRIMTPCVQLPELLPISRLRPAGSCSQMTADSPTPRTPVVETFLDTGSALMVRCDC